MRTDQTLAERALASEESRGGAHGPVQAGEQVLRHLRDRLVLWFGLDGFQALLARAVHRTQAEHPIVAAVQPQPKDGRHLDEIRDRAPTEEEAVRDALVALLTALFAILTRLVGDDLVTRLVHQLWPDGAAGARRNSDEDTHRD